MLFDAVPTISMIILLMGERNPSTARNARRQMAELESEMRELTARGCEEQGAVREPLPCYGARSTGMIPSPEDGGEWMAKADGPRQF
jgi:hypothetical protein